MAFWSWLVGIFISVFGSKVAQDVIEEVGDILREAITSWITNVRRIGIEDGAAFLKNLRELNAQINATGGSGSEKFDKFVDAAKVAIQDFGGDLSHELVESILNTGAELFHQPEAATKVEAAGD